MGRSPGFASTPNSLYSAEYMRPIQTRFRFAFGTEYLILAIEV